MNQCPECGFRAKDTICPLCGVRMRPFVKRPDTHIHSQRGEKCALPRQERTIKMPTAREVNRQTKGKTNWVSILAVIVIAILLHSCSA